MNILVFDIETVPDFDAGKKLYNLQDLDVQDTVKAMLAIQRSKNGSEFLPHFLHKIIVISVVVVVNNKITVWSLGDYQSDEAELIKRFFAGIDKYRPVLISWNGSGFDLPVLHYRALLHKIISFVYWDHGNNDKEFKWNNYLSRYHYRHLDVMDILAAYQNRAFAPLDDLAVLLGFPGKIGMHGDQVLANYLAEKLPEIRNYCEVDVLNTYCIYQRFELIRGNINHYEYDAIIQQLKDYLISENEKLHFQEFLHTIVEG